MNILEPCPNCLERQLGLLLRENRAHAVAFQTNGDVTLEHFMKAVMLLSGDRPRTLTLSVPIFTGGMMRPIARFMRLEWVAKLRLMTTDPLPIEILQQLAAKIGIGTEALLERIELAADAKIPDELMTFSGTDGTVVIQGRIYDAVTPRLTLYAGIFGRTEGKGVRSVMDAWNAAFRARRYNVNEELRMKNEEFATAQKSENLKVKSEKLDAAVPSVSSEIASQQTEQTEKPKKKRITRKNIKNNETKPMEAVAGAPQSEEETQGSE